MPVASVPIKPASKSKINWTQIISVAAMALSYVGFDLTPESQASVVTTIGVGTALVTWVFRTWFNKTVTDG